VVGVRGS
jgi:uncharacterized membrane protein (Fun14 family)